MTNFTVSSAKNPCPVCGRTKDLDCRTKEAGNVVLCHTLQEAAQDVPGYKYLRRSDMGAGWGVWVREAPEKIAVDIRHSVRQDFVYHGRDGKPLARICRNGRQFFQQRWEDGKWVSKLTDEVRAAIPVYRYPEVKRAIADCQQVFFVEGEGCADALWDIGIPATTTIGGCKGYRQYGDYSKDLEGADLVLCPDRDRMGIDYMQEVAKDYPSAKWCKVFPRSPFWGNLPENGGLDVQDWLSDGADKEAILKAVTTESISEYIPGKIKTLEESQSSVVSKGNGYAAFRLEIAGILALKDPIERRFLLADVARKYGKPMSLVSDTVSDLTRREQTGVKTSYTLQELYNLKQQGIQWLIPRFMPGQGMTLFCGFAKDGKSTLMYDLVASLALKRPFLNEMPSKQCRILLIESEENEGIISTNLEATGLFDDPGFVINNTIKIETDWDINDLDTLEIWINEHRPDVIFFDSLRNLSRNGGVSENSQEFAVPLAKLHDFLNHQKIPSLMIHHTNKDKEAVGIKKASGTSAITSVPDNIWMYVKDSNDPDATKRHLAMSGRNCRGRVVIDFVEDEYPYHHFEFVSEVGADLNEKTLSDRICKVLELNREYYPNGLTAGDIRYLLELPPNDRSIYKPLRYLVDAQIISCDRKEDDRRVRLYSLPSLPTDLPTEDEQSSESLTQQGLKNSPNYSSNYSPTPKTIHLVDEDDSSTEAVGTSDSSRDSGYSSTPENNPENNQVNSCKPSGVRVPERFTTDTPWAEGREVNPTPCTDKGGIAVWNKNAAPNLPKRNPGLASYSSQPRYFTPSVKPAVCPQPFQIGDAVLCTLGQFRDDIDEIKASNEAPVDEICEVLSIEVGLEGIWFMEVRTESGQVYRDCAYDYFEKVGEVE